MILEPLTETPVRGNVIMMLQMRRCGNAGLMWRWKERRGVVMEVVCLCEMGGEHCLFFAPICFKI